MSVSNLLVSNDYILNCANLYGYNNGSFNSLRKFKNQLLEVSDRITVAGVNQIVFTLPTITNTAYDIQFLVSAYCTSGTNAGNTYNNLNYIRTKNNSGTVLAPVNYLTSQSNSSTISVSTSITGTSINFILNADSTFLTTGNTWNWTWDIKFLTNNVLF
jgi:hypothetical protein